MKEIPANTIREKFPDRILRAAVSKMLPKNKLRPTRLDALKIYPDAVHPHSTQLPPLKQTTTTKTKWDTYDREAQYFPNEIAKKDMDT